MTIEIKAELAARSKPKYDCRHASYSRSNRNNNDMLVVKEYIVDESGKRTPNIRLIENYKRDFWITKQGYRTHTDKLEWEEESRLQKYTCTQAELPLAISRALGKPGVFRPVKQLALSPFLYGCDVATTSLIKNDYRKRWPDAVGPTSSVAVMDIETDVVNTDKNGRMTEEIIVLTLSYKDRIVTAVSKNWIGTLPNPEKKIRDAFDTYLSEYKEKRDINLEIYFGESPADLIKHCIKRAHEWMPDFVCFWNINFDMPRIIKALKKENCILEDIFSDPKVPIEYRHFNYIEGPSQKKTQSGKILPLHPADRWHTVECPASFYFLDSMCLYKRIRIAKGQEPSYSLDSVLGRNLSLSKLKFKELEGVSKLEWHKEMQTRFKAEYVVYNIFDCIGVELLDEQTGDASQAFSALCELCDFNDFKSTPRRIVNDLHYFCRERGYILASCPPDMEEELDKFVLDMKHWILILPANMADDNGVALFRDMPHIHSMLRTQLADLDIEGTYPNVESIMNISKETTLKELARIAGVGIQTQRETGINLTAGEVNAIEICHNVFKLPQPQAWVEAFQEDQKRKAA